MLEDDSNICKMPNSVKSIQFYLHSNVDLIVPKPAGNLAGTTYFQLDPDQSKAPYIRTGALYQHECLSRVFLGELKQGRSKMFTN